MIVQWEAMMSMISGNAATKSSNRNSEPVVYMIRKEIPQPRPKPPAKPRPSGIQMPGAPAPAGSIVCIEAEIPDAAMVLMGSQEAIEETVLESSAQKMLRKPSAMGGKSIHLTIMEGSDAGRTFDITGIGTYTVGRRDCDIILDDEKISRKHASIIIVRADQYAVTDLASRNGTFVNGIRLTRRNIQHNDLIRVGNTTLRFTVFDEPVPVEK